MRRSLMEYIESKQRRKDVADFRTGDTVRVHWKVKEGDKERVQPFEGIVIRKTRGQNRATFTVRKVSYGVGVERIFPLHSPRYEKIEVLAHGDVRRNRLFFLRNLKGKASRVETQEEQWDSGTPTQAPADGAPRTQGPADASIEAGASGGPANVAADASGKEPPEETAVGKSAAGAKTRSKKAKTADATK